MVFGFHRRYAGMAPQKQQQESGVPFVTRDQPSSSHYTIEEGMDEDNDGFGVGCPSALDFEEDLLDGDSTQEAPNRGRRRLAMVHRYLAKDAIANRAVFLVVLGFIAIFCVCIARNGVLDNVEWIRDRILMVDTSDLDARRLVVRSMSNAVPMQRRRREAPLALVIGATELQARAQLPYRMLQALRAEYIGLGMNLSAFVWVSDSDAVWTGSQCAQDPQLGWDVHVLTRRNATTMEALLLYMLQGMDVGVLYMDAGVVSVGGMQGAEVHIQGAEEQKGAEGAAAGLANILGIGEAGKEDVTLLSMFTAAHMAYMSAVMQPPSMPFVDASLLVAWPTEPSVALFREASERVHTLLLLPWVGNATAAVNTTPRGLSSYVLSTIPNDGRQVLRVVSMPNGVEVVEEDEEGRQELAFRHLPREGFAPAAHRAKNRTQQQQEPLIAMGATGCTGWGIVCCNP